MIIPIQSTSLYNPQSRFALVVVENRPVPEARQWQVSLLYDPAPGEIQRGDITLETSVLCQPDPRQLPPPLSQHEL